MTISVLSPEFRVRAVPMRRAVSYLADGRQVVWEPRDSQGDEIAVDAELLSRPVPEALAARFVPASRAAFYAAWTQAECAAKLNAVPILVWLRQHGLSGDARLRTATIVRGDLVITTARRSRSDLLRTARRKTG